MVVEEAVLIKCGYCSNRGRYELWCYPEGAKGPGKKLEVECMSGGTVKELEEELEYFLHMMIRCPVDGMFDPKDPLKNECKGCDADRDPIRNIIAHMLLEAEKVALTGKSGSTT